MSTGTKVFGVVVALLLAGIVASCVTDATSSGPQPGAGTTIADQMYNAIEPQDGEQITALDVFDDPTEYLMDRLMATSDANPDWGMAGDSMGRGAGEERVFSYAFQDGSKILLVGVPIEDGEGLKYVRTEIER